MAGVTLRLIKGIYRNMHDYKKISRFAANTIHMATVGRFLTSTSGQDFMLNMFYSDLTKREAREKMLSWYVKSRRAVRSSAYKHPFLTWGGTLVGASAVWGLPRSILTKRQFQKAEEDEKNWMVQQSWNGSPAFDMWNHRSNHTMMR